MNDWKLLVACSLLTLGAFEVEGGPNIPILSPRPTPAPTPQPTYPLETPNESLETEPKWLASSRYDFLEFMCTNEDAEKEFVSLRMALAQKCCARRGIIRSESISVVSESSLNYRVSRMYDLRDGGDFAALDLLYLMYGNYYNTESNTDGLRGTRVEDGDIVVSRSKEALLNHKYWYTDKTPDRPDLIDKQWYWSENHILIFHTAEFLAGQLFPNDVFPVTGLTGAQHMARVRPLLIKWMDERSRFGFNEWDSEVYYDLTSRPLLALVQFTVDDTELTQKSSMVLDLLFLDVGLHLHRGNFGATRGRSYAKSKFAASTADTFQWSQMLFEESQLEYTAGRDEGVFFACADTYVLPHVIRTIAKSNETMIDKERMNLPIPIEPDDSQSSAPYEFDFRDESDLSLWWSMSAMFSKRVLPLTIQTANKYDLWNSQFKDYADELEVGGVGVDDLGLILIPIILALYPSIWEVLNQGILEEVNTYTYRTAHYMLSTAQDYHAGIANNQAQTFQATLSENAVVFCQHPAKLAIDDGSTPPTNYNWKKDEPGPGYWTGDGARPRGGQYKNVGIYIYAPLFDPNPSLFPYPYLQETHAYFPEAHFDEVVQKEANGNKWTFGRKDDSYVGLYSYLKTEWRTSQPEAYKNEGKHFDLVAGGSARNVWMVELGSVDEYTDFATFCNAIVNSEVSIQPTAAGFDVKYASPSQGQVSFGSGDTPLQVNGEKVVISDYKRFDNPFVQAEFNEKRYEILNGDEKLILDFDSIARVATPEP